MKPKGRLFSIIFLLVLLLPTLSSLGNKKDGIQVNKPNWELKIKEDLPINIQNNTALAFYSVAGNGSASNPYIIENLRINASGLAMAGIKINNTSLFFIIRNCTILETDSGNGGIRLANVSNGKLINNTVRFCGAQGIGLWPDCKYNLLINNTLEHNEGNGIYLNLNSSFNFILNNTATHNANYGIRLYQNCSSNIISHNTAWNNGITGIMVIENCDNNTITDNTANQNNQSGILVWNDSDENLVENNIVCGNLLQGIRLLTNCNYNNVSNNRLMSNHLNGLALDTDCDHNNVSSNIIVKNSQIGIKLVSADNNIISGNVLVSNGEAISEASSSGNIIINNQFTIVILGNTDLDKFKSQGDGSLNNPYLLDQYFINASGFASHGIYIANTDAHFILWNCTVLNADSTFAGIYLENVWNGRLENNTANWNGASGIQLWNCSFNSISNNTLQFNSDHGIQLRTDSKNNTLSHNTATFNTKQGIVLYGNCNFNNITENWADNNEGDGIRLRDHSNWNRIFNNSVCGNGAEGVYLWDWNDKNILSGNNILNNTKRGIDLWGSNDNLIEENWILLNNIPIRQIACSGNIFQNNHYFLITSPENETYYAPMQGYYAATYSFDNIEPGNDDPSWVDVEGTSAVIASLGNHNTVYQCATGALGCYQYFGSQNSGTVELYVNFQNTFYGFQFKLEKNGVDQTCPLRIFLYQFQYYDGASWKNLGKLALNNVWYHIRIDFETTSGGYMELDQWYWKCLINGVEFGPYAFSSNNIPDTLEMIGSSYPIARSWDAVGYSWDPNYQVGDNQQEGLRLNFLGNNYNWIGLVLDNQGNGTIWGNHTIPLRSTGSHTVQLFGSDTLGTMYQSEVRYFQSYLEHSLLYSNHLENGQTVPPGLVTVLEDQDINITLTYGTISGGVGYTWTNASIFFKIKGIWEGPYDLGYSYGMKTSQFILKEGNFSKGDELFYYFSFAQFDNNTIFLKQYYVSQNGIVFDESNARNSAFYKKINTILHNLTLEYSVWYSAMFEYDFPSDQGYDMSFYQWARVAYENISLSFSNTTSVENNFSVSCINEANLNHTIEDASKYISKSIVPIFTIDQAIQSPFILNLNQTYVEDVSNITIPLVKFDTVYPNRSLIFTGELVNLTFKGTDIWPTPGKTAHKFTYNNNLTLYFDSITGFMVYYEHLWGSTNASQKLVMGLVGNNLAPFINLLVEKRTEIIDGGWNIIPNYPLAILYDPPGDFSLSQITEGLELTHRLNISSTFGSVNWTEGFHYGLAAQNIAIWDKLWKLLKNWVRWDDFTQILVNDSWDITAKLEGGTGTDSLLKINFEQTLKSSENHDDPTLIGPGRGDLYYGADILLLYLFIRENHYIIVNTSDGINAPVDDLLVWNNETQIEYGVGLNSQFKVFGKNLDQNNLSELASFNIFADNIISSEEHPFIQNISADSLYWSPQSFVEILYSECSASMYSILNTNGRINRSVTEFGFKASYEPALGPLGTIFYEEDNKIGFSLNLTLSLINSTATEANRQVFCHCEDNDGTPIGNHDQFLMDVYIDLRYGTFGYIINEDLTYTSRPFEFGTSDRRFPTQSEIFGLGSYGHGRMILSCYAFDEETGVSSVAFYYDDDPFFDLGDSILIGYQNLPKEIGSDIYQLAWNATGLQGEYFLFAVVYDDADPVKNYLVSEVYPIQIDNIIPLYCQIRVYEPFSGGIPLFTNTVDVDSGIDYVEYWDGVPDANQSILLGVSSDLSSSFEFVWITDPQGADDGLHYIYARAYDKAGNYLVSTPVQLKVDQSSGKLSLTAVWLSIIIGSAAIVTAILIYGFLRRQNGTKPPIPPPKQLKSSSNEKNTDKKIEEKGRDGS